MRRSGLVAFVVFAVLIGVARAGGPDATFGTGGIAVTPLSTTTADRLLGAAAGPNGGAYGVGTLDESGDQRVALARMTAAGSLDPDFGTLGVASKNWAIGTTGEVARGVAVQADGKIVVAGVAEHAGALDPRDRDIYVTRFETNGTVDNTFGATAPGVTVLDLGDGEVVGTGFVADQQWGLQVGPDDSLYLSGARKAVGRSDTQIIVVKLDADGARVNGFGDQAVAAADVTDPSQPPGSQNVSESVRGLELLADGSLVVAFSATIGGASRGRLAKFDAAGDPVAGFGTAGITTVDLLGPAALTVEFSDVEAQGSNLIVGGFGRQSGEESLDALTARFTAAGALDTTFGGGDGFERHDVAGFNDNARNVTVLADGRILASGQARPAADAVDVLALLYSPEGGLDTTFDGDGVLTADLGGTSDSAFGAAPLAAGKVMLTGARLTATAPTAEDAAWVRLATVDATPTPSPSPGGTATPGPSAPAPDPSVAVIKSTSLKNRRGKVRVAIGCSKGAGSCRGKARIRSKGKVKAGKRRKRIAVTRKVAYDVPAGATKRVTLRLKKPAKRALKKRRSFKVVVALAPAGSGAAVVATLKLKR